VRYGSLSWSTAYVITTPTTHDAQHACGDLGIEALQGHYVAGQTGVTPIHPRVETGHIRATEDADLPVHFVGIADREGFMAHQSLHPLQRLRQFRAGLLSEPFVDRQRIFTAFRLKVLDCGWLTA